MDKIYTKTGDKGYTTNLLNKRYSKGDIEMELQGGIDEINANVAYVRSLIRSAGDIKEGSKEAMELSLKNIQYHLYLIGVEISTEFTEVHVNEEEIKMLERGIDEMVDNTEPMKSFIYYSGSEIASYCHIVRTITRRVERVFVRALEGASYPKCYEYVNRLSDYFFTLSRYINHLQGNSDEPMKIR
jgi:cob(I)alamin adenosyltransferase